MDGQGGGRAALDLDACDLAFRIGQRLEKLVMEHAISLAVGETNRNAPAVVTIEHVRTSASACLPEDLRQHLGGPNDGGKG